MLVVSFQYNQHELRIHCSLIFILFSLADLQPLWNGFLAFWTFIIILQIIIPLSLYVTIELTKLSQVYRVLFPPIQ